MNSIPSFQALLRRYFQDLRADNWSPRTIDRRSYSLGRFLEWCDQRGIDAVTQITPQLMEAYRRSLFHYRNPSTGRPLKFATQASYLTALRHWCAWLVEQRWIATNPAADLRLPKEEHRLPSAYLTAEEVETLFMIGRKSGERGHELDVVDDGHRGPRPRLHVLVDSSWASRVRARPSQDLSRNPGQSQHGLGQSGAVQAGGGDGKGVPVQLQCKPL
jgi:hypothetical protein